MVCLACTQFMYLPSSTNNLMDFTILLSFLNFDGICMCTRYCFQVNVEKVRP